MSKTDSKWMVFYMNSNSNPEVVAEDLSKEDALTYGQKSPEYYPKPQNRIE